MTGASFGSSPRGTAPYEIRAMSMAEILDTGFQLVKNHFGLLVGISMIGQIPTIVIFTNFAWMLDPAMLQRGELPDIGAAFILAMGLYLVGMLVLMPFVIGSITAAIGDLYLGAEVSFESASRRGFARMVPLAVSYVIFAIVNGAALLVIALFVGALAGLASIVVKGALAGLLVGIGVLIGVPLLIGAAMLLAFMPGILAAVVVLEEEALFDAVLRTWRLVLIALGRTVGIASTVYLIVLIAPTGVQFLVGEIPIVGAVVWGVVQAVCQAYLFATAVVVYFDIRCRTESFDLEHLAQMVEGRAPSAVPIR